DAQVPGVQALLPDAVDQILGQETARGLGLVADAEDALERGEVLGGALLEVTPHQGLARRSGAQALVRGPDALEIPVCGAAAPRRATAAGAAPRRCRPANTRRSRLLSGLAAEIRPPNWSPIRRAGSRARSSALRAVRTRCSAASRAVPLASPTSTSAVIRTS